MMKKIPKISPGDQRGIVLIILLVLASNWLTYQLTRAPSSKIPQIAFSGSKKDNLYLMDQAAEYVYDLSAFEDKVRVIANQLAVPPEWIMAVMHSESRFDASVENFKGSGATGLIQFMPATAKGMNISTKQLRNMNHIEQLNFVHQYLADKQQKYRKYASLTDLYLAILYPKALSGDFCFTLYAKPSKAYQMNAGLDEDKDGRVTVSDIDRRMKRLYPTAYRKVRDL